MTSLRKKIFHFKIQNIISQNDFVLFFQFNNIKFQDWFFLKNQIFNFQNTSIIVIKNKIPYTIVFAKQAETRFALPADNSKVSFEMNVIKKYGKHGNNLLNQTNENLSCNRKKLNFLCQGPTLMIAFNLTNQCKFIYDILNKFTYNFSCSKFQFKCKSLNSRQCKKSCFDNTNLPLLFLQNTSDLFLQKYNSINKKNKKSSFFFMGGFIQGKTINHLDFEKLLQLDSCVYVDLIQQYSNPIVLMMFFNTIVKIKLMTCFQNNLLNLLNIYKHDFKKIES